MLELNKVFCGDCLELMKKLDNESIDLIITSPPYNVQKEYEKDITKDDYEDMMNNAFVEFKRILKPDGRFCINIPYQMYTKKQTEPFSHWYLVMDCIKNSGLTYRDNITWNQHNSDNDTAWGSWKSASSPWLRHQTEAIIIGYNKQWKKIHRGKSTISRDEFLKYVIDLWSMSTAKKEGHPAPFPLELPYRCIQLFSYEDDIILDPFIGGGTTAIACIKTNRNFIGMEMSEKYCVITNRCINDELSQLKLDF